MFCGNVGCPEILANIKMLAMTNRLLEVYNDLWILMTKDADIPVILNSTDPVVFVGSQKHFLLEAGSIQP
jgi:hypothetical protein